MATANIHNRSSIELIYSPEEFDRDSVENDRPGIDVLKGVRVLSAPDEHGNFELASAAKHIAEAGDSIFLVPYRSGQSDSEKAYHLFVRDIIEAAQRDGYVAADSPGQGDPRIRGARQ
jgi:hypothetical protein